MLALRQLARASGRLGRASAAAPLAVSVRGPARASQLLGRLHHLDSYTTGHHASFKTSASQMQAVVKEAEAEAVNREVAREPIGEGSAEAASTEKPPKDESFASLKPYISYPTWKALTVKPFGYKTMSDVQTRVLHLLPELADTKATQEQGRHDLLVKARTGTGKTLAFLVPAIEARLKAHKGVLKGEFTEPFAEMLKKNRPDLSFEALDKHGRTRLGQQFLNNTVGTLVISPTRELATQIATEATKLHEHHDGLSVQLLVGGASRMGQLRQWKKTRPDVVVATPGRIMDLAREESVVRNALSGCQTLILDEADTLLEMGFRDDIQSIISHIPTKEDRLTMLFSATVSRDIRAIARQTLDKNHAFIDCVPEGEDNVHKHIPQFATVLSSAADQIRHLIRVIAHDQLSNPGRSKIIIFAPTTKLTQMLSQVLSHRSIKACLPASSTRMYEIHSKKDQNQRFRTSDMFRKDPTGASVLVTSDVSARGVDYPGTTRVIQVGSAVSTDQYIHRIGRTGRAGKTGRADIILQPFEAGFAASSLRDLPVQDISTDAFKTELAELATRFDEDPTSVVPSEIWNAMQQAPAHDRQRERSSTRGKKSSRAPYASADSGSPNRPSKFQEELTAKLADEKIDGAIEEALAGLEEETVSEVFASLLGYYASRTDELRTTKSAMVDGVKQWAVEAGGLNEPPYVSAAFLSKLGIRLEQRRSGSRFGNFGGDRAGKPWEGRNGKRLGGFESSRGRGGYESSRGRGGYESSRGGAGGFKSRGFDDSGGEGGFRGRAKSDSRDNWA
ncbi:DEAD-domain-containing protein [Acaromyces ingoldii]|uniref:ATP-dependent RNA helicase n=1 Tax=Acaromyces ingoldii TaxID=215250 RepID=A0A316YQ61_9BASI|nr:DEAD-domain-containing protein [Acaromyces ingoldii]PWN91680.1 DEAD-domain-containing protein [Acaromyces ingoldii]